MTPDQIREMQAGEELDSAIYDATGISVGYCPSRTWDGAFICATRCMLFDARYHHEPGTISYSQAYLSFDNERWCVKVARRTASVVGNITADVYHARETTLLAADECGPVAICKAILMMKAT